MSVNITKLLGTDMDISKVIGVARILSGVHFFGQKNLTFFCFFSRLPQRQC